MENTKWVLFKLLAQVLVATFREGFVSKYFGLRCLFSQKLKHFCLPRQSELTMK